MLNNCYIELNHYLSIIIITIVVIIIIIIIIIIIAIIIVKSKFFFFSFLFFTLVSSCEYTEHLNRNVRRMDESKETFACSQV